jgi:hypothetical protein
MTPLLDDERPRFLADEGFNKDVTSGLRRRHRQLDLVTVQEAGLLHLSDQRLLVETQRLNRILLSHDAHTMPSHSIHSSLSCRLERTCPVCFWWHNKHQ